MVIASVEKLVTSDSELRVICDLAWQDLSEDDMVCVAWGYYFFSIQFRENLELACHFYPTDTALARLKSEECQTDNLSPYLGVATLGEKLDHDEFMRRALRLWPISETEREFFLLAGGRYLTKIHKLEPMIRALSIASYEDGGLERVFRAILTARAYPNPLLEAFRFFLEAHILFDSDPDQGHGRLSRTLVPNSSVVALWSAFLQLLLDFAPNLAKGTLTDMAEGANWTDGGGVQVDLHTLTFE